MSIIVSYQSNNPTPRLDLLCKIREDAIKIAKDIEEIYALTRLRGKMPKRLILSQQAQFFRQPLGG